MPSPPIDDLDFLTLYQLYAEEITDASPDYHRFMGLCLLGTILKTQVWFPFGDKRLFPNIWMILLGESTLDRKSTAIGIADRLLQRYCHRSGLKTMSYPNEFSHESLLNTFSKQPQGIFFIDEFATFLGTLNKSYNEGSKGLFATFYEFDGVYRRELRNRNFEIDHPCFSQAAVSTVSWFLEHLKESDIEGGLIVRYLLIPSTRKGKYKPLPPMADDNKRNLMYNWFDNFRKLKGAAYFTPRAEAIHNEWYSRMRARIHNSQLAPFLGRLQAYLIKFSMMIEINATQDLRISDRAVREAVHLIDWVVAQLKTIEENDIAIGREERDVQKVVKFIKASGGAAARSDISRHTHLGAIALSRAIETLQDREKILFEKDTPAQGKKARTRIRLKSPSQV